MDGIVVVVVVVVVVVSKFLVFVSYVRVPVGFNIKVR